MTKLTHVTKPLASGGKVLVLNTGAEIDPEAVAMLQALHSRSIGGIDSHLLVLEEKGPEKFMSSYYVGYGHKSIGDCGTVTLFIEGVSMLAAKAFQDWPLYSGQEASTRYIDFAFQPFIDPIGSAASNAILENWRTFYLKGIGVLQESLKELYPQGEGEDEKLYGKAIKARSLDIMRGFLPAGAATNFAWHTNLRQAADLLMRLRHHPLEEVRHIAEVAEEALQEALPSSFGHKRYEKTEEFNKDWMREHYYFTAENPEEFCLAHNGVNTSLLQEYKDVLAARPPKTEIPREIGETGMLQLEFLLDFGSFRDVQRHRAVTQRMPLHTTAHGFEEWYFSELPENFHHEAASFISRQEDLLKTLECSPEVKQYYIAMGYRLPNRMTGTIPALVYLAELRATRSVHPTLRRRAIQLAKILSEEFGQYGLVLHLDSDPDRFDVNRGKHDIIKKE